MVSGSDECLGVQYSCKLVQSGVPRSMHFGKWLPAATQRFGLTATCDLASGFGSVLSWDFFIAVSRVAVGQLHGEVIALTYADCLHPMPGE